MFHFNGNYLLFKYNQDGGKWKCEIQKFDEEPQKENTDRKVASLFVNIYATNQEDTLASTVTEKISIEMRNSRGN